jgi:hypothetical protein
MRATALAEGGAVLGVYRRGRGGFDELKGESIDSIDPSIDRLIRLIDRPRLVYDCCNACWGWIRPIIIVVKRRYGCDEHQQRIGRNGPPPAP